MPVFVLVIFLAGPGARAGWFSSNATPASAEKFVDRVLETWSPPATFRELFSDPPRLDRIANGHLFNFDVADEIETRLSTPSTERVHALLTLWVGAQHAEPVYYGAPPITVFPLRRALAKSPYPRVRALAACLLTRLEDFAPSKRLSAAAVESQRFYNKCLSNEIEPRIRDMISAILAGERVAIDDKLLSSLACEASLRGKSLGERLTFLMR